MVGAGVIIYGRTFALFCVKEIEFIKTIKIKDVVKKIENYVSLTEDGLPILEECCFNNGWDFKEFCDLIDMNNRVKKAVNRLLIKKRVNLEKFGVTGVFNKPMCALLLARLDVVMNGDSIKSSLSKLDKFLALNEEQARSMFCDEE